MPNEVDRIISEYDYNLDEDQQIFIESNYKNMELLELARNLHGDDSIDLRDSRYDYVRKYIAKLKRNVTSINFTDNQIEFIKNNASSMKSLEVARAIFQQPKLRQLSKEHRTVDKYIKALGLGNPDYGDDAADFKYCPPKADSKIVAKINQQDINANYNPKALNVDQKKNIRSLRAYLNSGRFQATINSIERKSHRDIFEGTFIQGAYDKPDLNAEELNMYISLCNDYVLAAQVNAQLETINRHIDNKMSDSDEDVKLRMGLVEMFSKKMTEYHQIQTRIEKLQTKLSDTRVNRLKASTDANSSLTKFVERWKSEENRKQDLRMAEAKNLELKKEIDRIRGVPEYVAHVLGNSEEELLEN